MALSASDIVVATTVEVYRGAEGLLEWLDEGDDAFDDGYASEAAGSRAAATWTTASPMSGRSVTAGR